MYYVRHRAVGFVRIEFELETPSLEIRAAALSDATTCENVSLEMAASILGQGERFLWIDVVGPDTPANRLALSERFNFHEMAVEDALQPDERPTLRAYGDTLYLSLMAPRAEGGFEEVAFFLRPNALISIANHPVPAVEFWFDRWVSRPSRLAKGPAYLLHALIDGIVDAYFPIVDSIEDRIETLSDAIYDGKVVDMAQLHMIRRDLIELRRILTPMRDVMNAFLRHDTDIVKPESDPYYQDIYDHILRLLENIDVNRDTLTSVLDVQLSTVSNNLNEVVKRMTAYSLMAMAAAFVTGYYGMNFNHMPDLDWAYPWYPMGVIAGVIGLVYLAFRRSGWI